MTDAQWQLAYCIWRLNLWSANYGSYSQIDDDVRDGKLTPGKYPAGLEPKKNAPQIREERT